MFNFDPSVRYYDLLGLRKIDMPVGSHVLILIFSAGVAMSGSSHMGKDAVRLGHSGLQGLV
jgi:hypothetical protein